MAVLERERAEGFLLHVIICEQTEHAPTAYPYKQLENEPPEREPHAVPQAFYFFTTSYLVMRDAPKIIAVCGSLRDGSHTRQALRHVLDAAEDVGAETELIDLTEWDLPLFDPNYDEQGDSAEIKAITREADAVILGSPVYHGSYSSALKSYMDYCSFDEFEDTTVGLLVVAGGGAYGPALEHMRAVCRGVHAWVLPRQVGVPGAYDAFDDDGEFKDENVAERVETLGQEIVKYADITPEKFPAEVEQSARADD